MSEIDDLNSIQPTPKLLSKRAKKRKQRQNKREKEKIARKLGHKIKRRPKKNKTSENFIFYFFVNYNLLKNIFNY